MYRLFQLEKNFHHVRTTNIISSKKTTAIRINLF